MFEVEPNVIESPSGRTTQSPLVGHGSKPLDVPDVLDVLDVLEVPDVLDDVVVVVEGRELVVELPVDAVAFGVEVVAPVVPLAVDVCDALVDASDGVELVAAPASVSVDTAGLDPHPGTLRVAKRLRIAPRRDTAIDRAVASTIAIRQKCDLHDGALDRVAAARATGAKLGPAHENAIAALARSGARVRIGYVLTDAHQTGSAISDSGDPFILPVEDPPFAAVGHVDGDVVRARRTALLLWNLGPTLGAAKP